MRKFAQTGPRTLEGKAISSRNAVKHGLSSCETVLSFEDQDEFNQLVDTYMQEQNPQNENETHLVREMATARWKLDRCRKIQNAMFERMAGSKASDDPYGRIVQNLGWSAKAYATIERHEAALQRTYYRAHKELIFAKRNPPAPRSIEEIIPNQPVKEEIGSVPSRPFEPVPSRPERVDQALARMRYVSGIGRPEDNITQLPAWVMNEE